MSNEDVKKAFDERWQMELRQGNSVMWVKGVRDLCQDFFAAGVAIGEAAVAPTLAGHQEDVPKVEVTDADFELWWKLYDKKRGKEKCAKKWQTLTKAERQACLDATPTYVTSTLEKQYRKDPYTYLYNKSWNDEIIDRDNQDEHRRGRYAAAVGLIAKYTGTDIGDEG